MPAETRTRVKKAVFKKVNHHRKFQKMLMFPVSCVKNLNHVMGKVMMLEF